MVCALLHTAPGFARQKTDLVFLNNGDRLTGEIKQLDRGILKLSTDAISTINIEWDDVDSLNSVYQFRVENTHGDKYFGSIFLTRAGVMQVIQGDNTISLSSQEVIGIEPLEAGFWQQLDGSVSLGFNYTKADDLTQFSFDGRVTRRTKLKQTQLDLDASLSNSSAGADQVRYDASLNHRRYFAGVFFGAVGGAAERNDELSLDLRTTALVAIGANLVQTNRTDFVTAVGFDVNHEWASDGTETSNIEGLVSVEHAIFAYDFPKIDYSLAATWYPSLNDWGRNRLEADMSLRREIISDFFVDWSFYLSYDNRPPGGGAKDDYGTVFSLGYSF